MIDVKYAYTAHPKHNFYVKKLISSYVLENNGLSLNTFNGNYFINDIVNRKLFFV